MVIGASFSTAGADRDRLIPQGVRVSSCPVLSFGRHHFSITSAESGEPSDPFSGLVGLVNLGSVR
jgi:hypothetical protein